MTDETNKPTKMKRREFLPLIAAPVAAAAAPAVASITAQQPAPQPSGRKPNIVFILMDNTGWGDLGVYGGMTPTPNIDSLAQSGIRFNNYTVECECTPSRSAIITGRLPIRSGTYTVPFMGGPYGLAPWEYTIANLLSDAGYATALFGKWHLGATPGRFPSDKGFDEWWGIPDTWDQAGYTSYPLFKESGEPVPMLWEGRKGQPSRPVMPINLENRPFMDEKYIIPKTVEYIQRQAAATKPFFVYVGYSELHQPVIANPAFAGKDPKRGGLYADVIGEMDFRVGQILSAIDKAGIQNNTIVVLSSDNGTDGVISPVSTPTGNAVAGGGGSSGAFRGNFFTQPFEGSYRTFAMIRWPGHIPAGVVTQEMFTAEDWLPTLAGLTGASNLVPKDRPIDGIDASSFMLGKSPSTGRDSLMYFGSDGKLMAVKWKIYKAVFRYTEGLDQPVVEPQIPLFYDLSSDPSEKFNLITANLTCIWILRGPVVRIIGAYEKSLEKYPNIKPGEDFKGYK